MRRTSQSGPATLAGGCDASCQPGKPQAESCTSKPFDPSTLSDPWSSYVGTKSSTGQPQPVRSANPPTAKRFEEQESRLAKLESTVSSLTAAQEGLAQEVSSSKTEVRQQLQGFQDDVRAFQASFGQQLQANIEALQASQQAQQAQMQQGLDDLKALLMEGGANPRPAKRPAQAKLDRDEQM